MATCFELIRSSSGPPRRHPRVVYVYSHKELFMFMHINNSRICLLGGPEDDLIRSKHVALTKYTIFVYK